MHLHARFTNFREHPTSLFGTDQFRIGKKPSGLIGDPNSEGNFPDGKILKTT